MKMIQGYRIAIFKEYGAVLSRVAVKAIERPSIPQLNCNNLSLLFRLSATVKPLGGRALATALMTPNVGIKIGFFVNYHFRNMYDGWACAPRARVHYVGLAFWNWYKPAHIPTPPGATLRNTQNDL